MRVGLFGRPLSRLRECGVVRRDRAVDRPSSHCTLMSNARHTWGSRRRWNTAVPCSRRSGRRDHRIRVRRSTPSNPRYRSTYCIGQRVRQARASRGTARASHFEYIREVRIEPCDERDIRRPVGVVRDPQRVDATAVDQDARSKEVNLAVRDSNLAVAAHVHVREIADEGDVVVGDRRTEQKRSMPGEKNLEFRQIPRATVIEPLLTAVMTRDVPQLVEDPEGIAVLEHPLRSGCSLLFGEDRELMLRLLARDALFRRRHGRSFLR